MLTTPTATAFRRPIRGDPDLVGGQRETPARTKSERIRRCVARTVDEAAQRLGSAAIGTHDCDRTEQLSPDQPKSMPDMCCSNDR